MTVQEFYDYCKERELCDCEIKTCSGPDLHDVYVSNEDKEDNIILLR